MSLKAQKRKSKKKYFQSSKKSKCAGLEPGMKGFLITCNDEHRCVKEAYNLLNEFADDMYGPEYEEMSNENSEDVDIGEQLAKEISAIKSKRRFQQVFIKAKGIIFINTTVPDPMSLANKIFESVISSGKKKTRFILKFKPVVATCKAYEDDIRKTLDDLLQQYVSDDKNKELKYKVESKVTFNDSITSSHLIWYVRDSAKSCAPNWEASILDPQIILSFYVLKSVCCISILEHYEKFKKYNLSMVVTPTIENQKSEMNASDSLKSDILSEDAIDKEVSSENVKNQSVDQ